MKSKFLVKTIWDVEIFSPEGKLIGTRHSENLVPDAALNDILDEYFGTGTTRNWKVALWTTNTTLTSAATYAVPEYTEVTTQIDETSRVPWVSAAASGKAKTNAANKAIFTFNTALTIYGGSLVGAVAAGVATKGDTAASDGIMYAGSLFGASVDVVNGSSLKITCTVTSADDGI